MTGSVLSACISDKMYKAKVIGFPGIEFTL